MKNEEEFTLDDIAGISDDNSDASKIMTPEEIQKLLEEANASTSDEEISIGDFEISDVPETETASEDKADISDELSIDSLGMDNFGIDNMDSLNIDNTDIEDLKTDNLSIDGLDEAITSETELEMAGELNIDELGELGGIDDSDDDNDDNLDDVLSMLDDDDAELAEINDMLKKSDNNELIEDDDMMSLLNQMADDEAASINAGVQHIEDDDGGVPLPELPKKQADNKPVESTSSDVENQKKSKFSKKKGKESEAAEPKKPSKLSKLFNVFTEEYIPEPTEEELAAEKEAKAAKKQEERTKKEEEKLAKAEEKKVKDEEKAAAKKAKAEADAQKKKEKQEAKAAKAAAKKAKQEAEPKVKRVPPKKVAVAVVFGVTVFGAIMVSTNILSVQGYLRAARKAYYNHDYKTVYLSTYGMKLNDSDSDGLIQAKSETILKLQRRYASYQNNIKMGREVEALDALLQGIVTYDTINAAAEQYGVSEDIESIKTDILNVLQTKYGLDESMARELAQNEDALSYTMALTDIVAGDFE